MSVIRHSFFIVHFLKINFHELVFFILTVIELMKMTKQLIHFYQLFLRRQTFFTLTLVKECYEGYYSYMLFEHL